MGVRMKMQALDVTLRDGGNRNNFHFTAEHLQNILPMLDQSGIEFIEIGYRNGAIRPVPNLGSAGMCSKPYLLQCKACIKNAKIAVMAHPQNIDEVDLEELKELGVSLLRICILKGEASVASDVVKLAQKLGFITSLNVIHVSYYSEEELDRLVTELVHFGPDIIYFADSNGCLFPEQVAAIYKRYTRLYATNFGFHAHDNLGLAQANTIAALDEGVQFIDFSLAGMGKGIGNLKTEFFTAYLHALGIKKYNLEKLLRSSNYVRQVFNTDNAGIDFDEFTRGIFNLSTADLKKNKS